MNNFGKKLWFGALLNPLCWLCAAANHQVIGGFVAVTLFLLIQWYITAGWVALFVILFMAYLVITPEKAYTLQMADKRLLITVYRSDFKRRHKQDFRRKCSLIRAIALHSDGTHDVLLRGNLAYGYDDNLCAYGIFLIKPYPAMWAIICNGFEDGRFLGRKLKDYAFAERGNGGITILRVLHGTELATFEARAIDIEPKVSFDPGKAAYHPAIQSVHEELSSVNAADAKGSLLVIDNGTCLALLKCCLTPNGMPATFKIAAPWVYLQKNGKNQVYTADDRGNLFLAAQQTE